MDAEITKAITSLDNRMYNQEQLHKNIDVSSHGVINNLPAIIVAVALSALVAVIIVKNKDKIT